MQRERKVREETSANKRKDIEHKYDEPAEANEKRVLQVR